MKKQLILCLVLIVFAYADNYYGGIWLPGNGTQYVYEGSWIAFVNRWNLLSQQNLRLVDIEIYNDANTGALVYGGVFRTGSFGHYLYSGFTWSQFTDKWNQLALIGFRLINVETYIDGGVRKYAGVWHAGNDAYYLWRADWNGFVTKWNQLSSSNLRLVDVETYLENGVVYYIGVWRYGIGAHYLWNADWSGFVTKWNQLTSLRLNVFKTYTDNSGNRKYIGVWRPGTGGYYLWNGVDRENFYTKISDLIPINLRLKGLVVYPGACPKTCTNLVACDCVSNYILTGDSYVYKNPVKPGSPKYVPRLSALYGTAQIFKLPFSNPNVRRVNGWLYGPGQYHHAVDYTINGATTFSIKAAASGTVIYAGWDDWLGNTIVIKHSSSEGVDSYRTLYMHVRNGTYNDCAKAWSVTIPSLTGSNLINYKNHLTATGCTQNPLLRNPKPAHWGTEATKILVRVGQYVTQGTVIAYSGQTGPGGVYRGGFSTNTNNHLHIAFTRKDTDGHFYYVDPYGVYGLPECYPSPIIGPYSATDRRCIRYPVLFQNGYPRYS